MSKYAVIKIGSSQERVSIGDKLLVSNSFEETSLTPILVSPRKGQLVTEEKKLKNFKINVSVIAKCILEGDKYIIPSLFNK